MALMILLPIRKATMQPEDLIKADSNGCWLWYGKGVRYGANSRHGPELEVNGRAWMVKHLLWMKWKKRPLPNGGMLHHTCSNRMCINPSHYRLVDSGDGSTHIHAHELGDIQELDLLELYHAQWGDELAKPADIPTALRQAIRKHGRVTGCIYFVQGSDGGPIKIGYTQGSVADRLRGLQTGASSLLVCIATMPGSYALEKRLHELLAEHRQQGEWFNPSPVLLGFIDHIQLTSVAA